MNDPEPTAPCINIIMPLDDDGVPMSIMAYCHGTPTYHVPAVVETLRRLADNLESSIPTALEIH